MLKNKKFAITASLATAAIVALGFEIDCTIQQLRTLKRDSNAYKTLYQSQKDLTNLMLSDIEKANDIETLNNIKAYWTRILKTD